MRIKPARARLPAFGSDFQGLNSGEPSPIKSGHLGPALQFKGIQAIALEPAVHELVERRVRGSLKLVQRGELSAQQALKSVVNRLADELTDSQYHSLIAYFRAKESQGQLAPAKQLLLRRLTAAKSSQSVPPARDQQSNWDIENTATAPAKPALHTSTAVIGIADLGLKGLFSPDCNTTVFDTAKHLQAVNKPLSWN
eukprot:GHUV01024591.1.p1 GENE.GHUV01024591.1~~GHUV01024591.1.p1  ORF type:complete len:197 (+),score=36.47 GHUV01024591.1:179-769(+)